MKDKAKQLYLKGKKLIDISKQLNISESTIRVWKKRYNWDDETLQKEEIETLQRKDSKKKNKEITEKEYSLIDEVAKEYKLTNQQVEFAIYMGNGNTVMASCLKAKYSKSYSMAMGYNLLGNVGIKKIVDHIKRLRYQTIMYNERDVLNQYIRIAQGDLGDYFNDSGTELKDFREVDTGIIKEYQVTVKPDGTKEVKFKLESKHPALKSLGEYFGMFKDNNSEDNNSKVNEKLDEIINKVESDFNDGSREV